MIEAAALLPWLREQLGRPDLADALERLLGDNTLNDDLRLLEFCHALWKDMPAIWRGRPLTGVDLRNAAMAGERGDRQSLEWLQSLLDGRCFDFYSRIGHANVEMLGQRFREAWDGFHHAWEEMIRAGAPATLRQNDEEALPLVVATAFSGQRLDALRQELRQLIQPVTVLLCEDWFLRFGMDIEALSDPQLLTLRHLARTALTNERTAGAPDVFRAVDLKRLGEDVVVLSSMQRLLRTLVVRPGTLPIVLRPGEVYRSTVPQTLGEHVWAQVGPTVQRTRRWLVRRRTAPQSPPASETPASPAVPGITASMRLVRVTAAYGARALAVRDEYYLALVAWEAPEGWQVRLRLTMPSLVFPVPRLRTELLPQKGRLLVLLTSDTRTSIFARRGWTKRMRTPAMDVHFGPKEKLFKATGNLRYPRATLSQHAKAILEARARLARVIGTILPVSPARIMERAGGLMWAQSPKRVPRPLRMALQSLLGRFR